MSTTTIAQLREQNRLNNQAIRRIQVEEKRKVNAQAIRINRLKKDIDTLKIKRETLYKKSPLAHIIMELMDTKLGNETYHLNRIKNALRECRLNEKLVVLLRELQVIGYTESFGFDEIMDIIRFCGFTLDEIAVKAYYDNINKFVLCCCDICTEDNKKKIRMVNNTCQRVCECTINVCDDCGKRIANKKCPTCRTPYDKLVYVKPN